MMERETEATKALALLLLLAAAGGTYGRYEPEDVELTFNLDERPLSELMPILRGILVNNRPQLIIAGGVYMAPKSAKGHGPCRWIKLTLIAGGARTTIAIDDGDLYLLAFRNMEGQWYSFKGFVPLFDNAQALAFKEDYGDLIEGRANLVHVPLGRAATVTATKILAGFKPETTPQDDIKRALTTLVVTICEALRFNAVRHAIVDNWESQTFLTEEQTKMLGVWGNISYCLFLWETNGRWIQSRCKGAKNSKVRSKEEALQAVDLFMRPRDLRISEEY